MTVYRTTSDTSTVGSYQASYVTISMQKLNNFGFISQCSPNRRYIKSWLQTIANDQTHGRRVLLLVNLGVPQIQLSWNGGLGRCVRRRSNNITDPPMWYLIWGTPKRATNLIFSLQWKKKVLNPNTMYNRVRQQNHR